MHRGILVALAQYSALALLDVAGPPRSVEVMEGNEPLLYVHSGAHFLCRTKKDADAAGVHRIKQRLLLDVSLRIVNRRDLLRRDPFLNKFAADFIIDVEFVRVRCREVAED